MKNAHTHLSYVAAEIVSMEQEIERLQRDFNQRVKQDDLLEAHYQKEHLLLHEALSLLSSAASGKFAEESVKLISNEFVEKAHKELGIT